MKLFFIRHGETVDNVAQLYAGIRDSILTSHGILQAERLGQHFAQAGFKFTKIFSSDLQRAYKTAEAIRSMQSVADHNLAVTQLPVLREQDFGSYEGKPYRSRQSSLSTSTRIAESSEYAGNPDFTDVESTESMNRRTEVFVRDELIPLLRGESPDAESVICVVSHGIILSHLWRSLLKEFPRQSVFWGPDCTRNGNPMPLEHLGGWSNTGYLQLDIRRQPTVPADFSDDSTFAAAMPMQEMKPQASSISLLPFHMTIITVNGKDHLQSLKPTRGGLGSSGYDESQKKIDTFFKKKKL